MSRSYLAANIAALVLLFMLSLLALGFFVGAADIINGQGVKAGSQPGCLLFAPGSDSLSQSSTCDLVISCQAVTLAFSLVCFVVHHLIEKCTAGGRVLKYFLMVEMAAYVVIILLLLCLGIVFTLGLLSTCDTLIREGLCSSCNKCKFFRIGEPGRFFSLLMLALVSTWTECVVLSAVIVLDITWLCSIYRTRAKDAERRALLKEEEKKAGIL